jgi:hypothetical protein
MGDADPWSPRGRPEEGRMHTNLGFRSAVFLAASTIATIAVVAVGAPAESAAAVEEYATSYEASCVLGPGTMNVAGRVPTSVRLSGPESVEPNQAASFKEASVAITASPEWTDDLAALGVSEIRGVLTRFVLEATNMKPSSVNLATAHEGLQEDPPFQARVERGSPLIWGIPRSGSFSETVSGVAGEHAVFGVENASAFEEIETGFRATGVGSLWSFEGFDSAGEKVTGPIGVVCRAPSGVNVAVIPIERPEYKNWILSGTLAPKRLKGSITLPAGARFNGVGELNEAGVGAISAGVNVPPFTSTIMLYGLLPVKLGTTVTQVGPMQATLAKSQTVPGDETMTLPAQLSLGVTSLSLLGLTVPTMCSTIEPLSLELVANLTREELMHRGWSFSGTTAVPGFKCQGGLLGTLFGEVLNSLLSGPEAPYTINVSAPGP